MKRRKNKKKIRALVPQKIEDHLTKKNSEEAPAAAPRITNETVAEHREEVLSSARKYIYPLGHSKHRIVIVSTSLFVAAMVAFFSYCILALYRFQSTSTFVYGVTQVIPFPIAKAGSRYVSYENYLFELRHYMHYYESQQKVDFNSTSGKQQLADFKKRALGQVIDNVYIKELAAKNKVSVSNQEVNDDIAIVRNENRLGGSDKVFADVLKDYWGWSVDDFKRSLREELLSQKVVSTLDTDTHTRAQAALNELNGGADFAAMAAKYSDDPASKGNGGDYGFPVDTSNRDIPAQTVNALFKLKPGEHSGIVNTGDTLEIVKNIEMQGTRIHAAHIVFTFKPVTIYTDPLKNKDKVHQYITLK